MRLVFSMFLLQIFALGNAQIVTKWKMTPMFNKENLDLNKASALGKDTITITNFKFYISNVQYFIGDSMVHIGSKKAHLVDASVPESFVITETTFFEFNKIKFNLGIDSQTNVSGVLDGDLDPTNGMYWTWQSGYINFKLEGIASHCPSRNHKFYWHIGGYLNPFYTMREVLLNCHSSSSFEVFIHFEELFGAIDVSKVYQVMSPSEKAIGIADELQKIFSIEKE